MNHDMYNRLVRNKRLLFSIPLLLASLFLASHAVPSAHAQFTGKVCITATTTATSCATSAPVLGPFTAGSTFTVGVFIQGSDAMGGFDIYVKSDPTFVTPVSAALGSLIVTPSLTSICVNGAASTGSCTVGTANGAGVVEVTTIEGTGVNECGGISPCSGLAFTITYSVVGATPTTTLSYPSAAGCANTSVTGTTTCALVADAIGTTLPETVQGATVSINLPNAVLCATYPQTAAACSTGPVSIPSPSGTVTVGSTYVVGFRIEGSQPLAGFDIYVAVDTHYVLPVSAGLGTLIVTPSLTSICVNGSAQTGSCTIGTANGPGVVEVSTIEGSGSNECAAAPCSGLAFNVTYRVVGVTPTTPISYPTAPGCSTSSVTSPPSTCVLVANAFGATVPESIQGANLLGPTITNPTIGVVSCISPASVGPTLTSVPTTCFVTETDSAASGKVSPITTSQKHVTFTSDGLGSFVLGNKCELSAISASASQCSVLYQPTGVGNGITHIGALYDGDTVHSGNTAAQFSLVVTPASVIISTQVIIDQTGFAANSSIPIPQGLSVHDIVILNLGYPVTGATGHVTYTLYPNLLCTALTGTVVATVTVTASDNVAASPSVAPAPGSWSFQATYTNDTANNSLGVSPCEPFTVIPSPSFTAGKLHWTHHLSLSKSASTQSWTAIVTNPLSTTAKLVVRITGVSTINPSLTFDITCGITCVNTALGGVNATPGLTPVSVAAGTSSTSFSFNQIIPGTFVNQKFSFTATLYWSTGTGYTPSTSKSGSFAIVP